MYNTAYIAFFILQKPGKQYHAIALYQPGKVSSMKIFVPGRICLFGEHSDWAGGYRRINAKIEKGYTLILQRKVAR